MFTKEEAENLLKLIDRALKSGPQPGGLQDLVATSHLVRKLASVVNPKADNNGAQDLPTAG